MVASTAPETDIDWLERDRNIIKGLDHLGVQSVSVNLYTVLLPGITNVTDRARYFAFYPWVVHRYAQAEGTRGRTEWLTWFRRLDFAYCLASVAHEIASGSSAARATAAVGADTARSLLRDATGAELIDFRAAADLDSAGKVPKKNAYFQNKEGGLAQYYKGPMRDLGLIQIDSAHQFPNIKLTSYAGLPIAESLDDSHAFNQLIEIARAGKARFTQLAKLGAELGPSSIASGSREQRLLRALFDGTDDNLCRAQTTLSRSWRRNWIRLALSYTRDAEAVEGEFPEEFRWACHSEALPDGSKWHLPDDLRSVSAAWGSYQRNDLLNFALECFFWMVLRAVDARPQTPRRVATRIADLACAAINETDDTPALGPIDGSVSAWVGACQRSDGRDSDPWDETSTWRWVEALRSALGDERDDLIGAWAVRVLGRLASERGTFQAHPFEGIPGGPEMAAAHEVQFHSWLDRASRRSSESARSFIAELVLEWGVFRHLRVATRKLAAQGVSTFKLRPERGQLVLASEDIPYPTLTNPRIRQGHRILVDLGLLSAGKDATSITSDGVDILEKLS